MAAWERRRRGGEERRGFGWNWKPLERNEKGAMEVIPMLHPGWRPRRAAHPLAGPLMHIGRRGNGER
jgi:hypothetical protein